MEIIKEVEIPEFPERPMIRIAGIDLGINNFATITNNIGVQPIIINGKGLKAMNQFYNKRRAQMQSDLKCRNGMNKSRALEELTFKRFCRIKNFMHAASRKAVNYCLEHDIDTLVCGLNSGWKQEVNTGRKNNQKFVSIPYDMFIRQLEYKCQENGIKFTTTEEAYTSGTSFLDGEQPVEFFYNKNRRVHRGLFKSENGLINADVNGSLQIIRKVSENAFAGYSVEVACLQPLVLNVA
jgi:putative transposase